ncbi:uncharacterized protein LOC116947118 isoform X2 [Petromyzon marinus]|uniref:uncharacterized protein LOC116947118 isoform X2 n=1 Tax=Petromyzon marinus TaxID=7757 RepID=UPI003F6F4524
MQGDRVLDERLRAVLATVPGLPRISEGAQRLEQGLAGELSELRAQLQESGLLSGAASRSVSSVSVPKDASYFRRERELRLAQALQVSGALPVQVHADAILAELNTCLAREHMPGSLPLLLHQFFVDRMRELARLKHVLILRWERFCCHVPQMQHHYAAYQQHVALALREYSDARERARRLAAARDTLLAGVGAGADGTAGRVAPDDCAIYARWLVGHLRSVRLVHSFVRFLQWLPVSHGALAEPRGSKQEEEPDGGNQAEESPPRPGSTIQHSSALCVTTENAEEPLWDGGHGQHAEAFMPQLLSLLSHFGVDWSPPTPPGVPANGELLAMVSQKFGSIFKRQEEMKCFPVYSQVQPGGVGALGTVGVARRKEATWLPYIKVRPCQDPWQETAMQELRECRRRDELLHVLSQFLQISNAERVMLVLKKHAATMHRLEVTGHLQTTDSSHVWSEIYGSPALYQNSGDGSPSHPGEEPRPTHVPRTSHTTASASSGYSLRSALQQLGVDEERDDEDREAGVGGHVRRDYLAFMFLRHLRIRELQRECLGLLNYFRSVERSITIDQAGLSWQRGSMGSTSGGWVGAARGGGVPLPGRVGSQEHLYNSPADYMVREVEFMELTELENHQDFCSEEGAGLVQVRDPQGVLVMYDVALSDLRQLEAELLLVAQSCSALASTGTGTTGKRATHEEGADRFSLLMELWGCEAAFLQDKRQLVDCYFQAYEHSLDGEERVALAQIIADTVHQRPRFEQRSIDFAETYRMERACLQTLHQLLVGVMDRQVAAMRDYARSVWRDGERGNTLDYGLPPRIVPTEPIALASTSSAATRPLSLLEVHPSLGLVWRVTHALRLACSELSPPPSPQRLPSGTERLRVEQRVLRAALATWAAAETPELDYGAAVHRELFGEGLLGDPWCVCELGSALVGAGETRHGGEETPGQRAERALSSWALLLDVLSLRHRIAESAHETALLARLYKGLAGRMGFEECHLYLRPVPFEFASHGDGAGEGPVFLTATLDADASLDRFIPSQLPLAISELDEAPVKRLSFHSLDSLMQLMSRAGVECLQLILLCQVTHKNGLVAALQQASFCQLSPLPHKSKSAEDSEGSSRLSSASVGTPSASGRSESEWGGPAGAPGLSAKHPFLGKKSVTFADTQSSTWLAAQAFVSLQLERRGARDAALRGFLRWKGAHGALATHVEEVDKIKRILIVEFCQSVALRMAQFSARGQILASYAGLRTALAAMPALRDSHFMLGDGRERKGERDSESGLTADPRRLQARPRRVLSADGRVFLNAWFIPHPREVLQMFSTMEDAHCYRALRLVLRIACALHDIVLTLSVSALSVCTPLGTSQLPGATQLSSCRETHAIESELHEIQRQLDELKDPRSPEQAAELLCRYRQVTLLKFEAASSDSLRASGAVQVSEEASTTPRALGVPAASLYGAALRLPRPVQPGSPQAAELFPWRSFLNTEGPYPGMIGQLWQTQHGLQLRLCGLTVSGRRALNGEILGVSLLLEDVLQRAAAGGAAFVVAPLAERAPHGSGDDDDNDGGGTLLAPPLPGAPRADPLSTLALLEAFLLLCKRLELLKVEWGHQRPGVSDAAGLSKTYRVEILAPALKALACRMGLDAPAEARLEEATAVPAGASEVDVRMAQLEKLIDSLECTMIQETHRKISAELALAVSERAREEAALPTDLWRHPLMSENLTNERPAIVEDFVHHLLEHAQLSETEVRLDKVHLSRSLATLASHVMQRERSNFQAFSMFYEHLLRHQQRLLQQREQEVAALQEVAQPTEQLDVQRELGEGTLRLLVEVTSLRSQLAEARGAEERARQQARDEERAEYDALMRSLCSDLFAVMGALDEFRTELHQEALDSVALVRREGVESIRLLRRKSGVSREDYSLQRNLKKHEEVQRLREDKSHLETLVSKMRVLSYWRQSSLRRSHSKSTAELQQALARLRSEQACVRAEASAETTSLRARTQALQQALTWAQAEGQEARAQLQHEREQQLEKSHREQQERQVWRAREEAHASSAARLSLQLSQNERQLGTLSVELEKSERVAQLQHKRLGVESRQMRSQLEQERGLKLDAFQLVDELQGQLNGSQPLSLSAASHSRSSLSQLQGYSRSSSSSMRKVVQLPLAPRSAAVVRQAQNALTPGPSSPSPPPPCAALRRPKTASARLRGRRDPLVKDLDHTLSLP